MTTAVIDDIVRQRDAELKAAVRSALTGDVTTGFAKLSDDVRQADREGLVAECVIEGPARRGEKPVPRDLTRAEMARASNNNVRDT